MIINLIIIFVCVSALVILRGDYEYISIAASWILLSIIFMCIGRALAFLGQREEIIPLPEAVSSDDVH